MHKKFISLGAVVMLLVLTAGLSSCSKKSRISGLDTPLDISTVTANVVSNSSVMITWTTSREADSLIQYGASAAYGSFSIQDTVLVTAHTVTLTGLVTGTTYHYQVISTDANGNQISSNDYTFSTTNPVPIISGVAAGSITDTGATITWTTDKATTSKVEYGTTANYGSASAENANLVTSHTVTLTGLTKNTTYHYRVVSKDSGNNEAKSADNTCATTNGSGGGGGGNGTILFDFEGVTPSGWIQDTSTNPAYFGDCFGLPKNSTDVAHSGTQSLAIPFDLTKPDPNWSCLNDAIFKTADFNFNNMNKLTIYMYLPASATSSISKDIEATVYVKTGSSWYWYESNTLQAVTPGTWTAVSIDFKNAKHDDSAKNIVVNDLNNVKEIGVHLGNGNGNATTTFYIDDVTVE
jgi:hypothetical protein